MYRIAPQCASAPLYLVPKPVQQPSVAALDRRGAFLVRTQEETLIWKVWNGLVLCSVRPMSGVML
jgi:hypothetical protein